MRYSILATSFASVDDRYEVMAMYKSLSMNTRKTSNPLASLEDGFYEKKVSLPMVQVGHYRLPAFHEASEDSTSHHFVTVHLNRDRVVKSLEQNGHLQRDSFGSGDICLTPAQTSSAVRIEEPCEIVAIHIEPTFFAQAFAEIADAQNLELMPLFNLRDPLIYQMAIALKEQIESSEGAWNRLYIESMVTAACAHLLQCYSTQSLNANRLAATLSPDGLSKACLDQVLDYIHKHTDQNLSLAEMAQSVQMSSYHFSRLFKQSTGQSPHQYLISRRVQHVKRLLATTGLSIAEIAAQTGFTDQSHLIRHFKRQVGVTPSQFR
jgi:AraC family transcriptional regulator